MKLRTHFILPPACKELKKPCPITGPWPASWACGPRLLPFIILWAFILDFSGLLRIFPSLLAESVPLAAITLLLPSESYVCWQGSGSRSNRTAATYASYRRSGGCWHRTSNSLLSSLLRLSHRRLMLRSTTHVNCAVSNPILAKNYPIPITS